jgi:hypothetical protein
VYFRECGDSVGIRCVFPIQIHTNGLKIRGRSWGLKRATEATRFARPTITRHNQERALSCALKFNLDQEG